jgi:hypothetical protein
MGYVLAVWIPGRKAERPAKGTVEGRKIQRRVRFDLVEVPCKCSALVSLTHRSHKRDESTFVPDIVNTHVYTCTYAHTGVPALLRG